MATLALAAVGAALGGTVLPAGIGFFGATLSGAAIGSQIGSLAGAYVDQALFGSSGQSQSVEGPRLTDLQVTSSTEGAPIPCLFGRARLGGQIIWASDFDEEVITTRHSSGGGKGGGLSGGGARVTEYQYFANFAVALCEGDISRIGRVWADGREIDLARITWRLYRGTEDQLPDSLIEAREGTGQVPAYRGLAYIVFERLPLVEFGNRIPQLTFEVFRNVGADVRNNIRAVALIPGSGEFVYATEAVRRLIAPGVTESENVHTLQGGTDWQVALDQMEADLPSVKNVSLIVSWFGDDLRAENCQLRPGVETSDKQTEPVDWNVAGVARGSAYVVSQRDGRAAYGGTPSDSSVIEAIRDLKARGLGVMYTPFILMDVADGNALPNPYGGSGQAAYPWRGRITCSPAAGQAGTPDKTAGAAAQVAAFVGTASVSDFALDGEDVVYSGPAEWSYRRMILHQALLAKAAGGVEAFQIGSEMRGLTWVRSDAASYPFVDALQALADDVKSVLGPETKVLYGADWSEYFGHQPADGSGDVYFHLDPLWASASIDCIGIDVYWPLSDWRDGNAHLDYFDGYRSIYDVGYLKRNVRGGEGFDWYYASAMDRANQARTEISDGTGKPWVFRYKDIRSWWENAHYNRPGGVESATPTDWVPQSKPFWITEIGCSAADKGSNQPNVFVDPKSSENALPYFSSGVRDDLIQKRYLQAFLEAFDWAGARYLDGANPVSTVTSERMLDVDHCYAYCWDARPYPAFPHAHSVWGDGINWSLGHWLNGRLGAADLRDLVLALMARYEFDDGNADSLAGTVPGYVVDRVMSARDALQPLELAYFFDSIESEGRIDFRPRGLGRWPENLVADAVVEKAADAPLITLVRGQETELPASAKLRFISGEQDYRQAVSEARHLTGASGRVAQATLPIVLDDTLAGPMAETWLFEAWAARERGMFELPPSALALEAGDVVEIDAGGRSRLMRVTDVSDHGARQVEARGFDQDVYARTPLPERQTEEPPDVIVGSPDVTFLDLPDWTGEGEDAAGIVAAFQKPWPGSVAVYSSPQTSGYQFQTFVTAPATVGELLDPIAAGVEGRLDYGNNFRVKLSSGALQSVDVITMLTGANVAAVRSDAGDWEIIQFLNAELIDDMTYLVSGLLRGQFGTEGAFGAVSPGALFVVLDNALARFNLDASEYGLPLNWRVGPANRDIGDESFVTESFAFLGLHRRPYSPVHIRRTNIGNDIMLNWKRRARVGGDNWESHELPLAEETEAYEVDILDGSTVRRTLTVNLPSATYTELQQIDDFGAVQSSLTVRVVQMSATFGRGRARTATV